MKKNMRLLGNALLMLSLIAFTGCKELVAFLDNPVNAYMEMDETELTIHVGETAVRRAETISTNPVIYTSSDTTVVTVDPLTGEVTGVDGGTATITARVEANDDFNADVKTYNVTCYKDVSYASAGDEGRLVCKDGHIHKLTGEEYCQAERMAMVAYVGNESNCAHGLAIAFKDINDEAGSLDWEEAKAYVDTWEEKYPVANATWRMPSNDDYQYMVIGCGSTTAYRSHLYFSYRMDMEGLNSKMTEAGAEPIVGLHWTSDAYDKYNAWEVHMNTKSEEDDPVLLAFVYFGTSSNGDKTRYCLAF